nr:hypothetical protein BaRGS_006323 [Batillaria attramentaria]
MRDRDQIQMTACTAFHTQKTEGKTVAAALKAELLGDIPGIVRSVEELYRPGDNTRHFWQKANAVWRSLALLLRQREFVFGTLFAQKQVFPRIYGTCGPYYLQESCSSDQIHNEYSVREVFFGDTPIPWSTRATAALKVLQFLKHMHSQLPENLVLIDVQAGQFGVCADGRARVTDCDEARFKYNFGSSATVSGADLAGVLAGHRNSSSCETDLDCSNADGEFAACHPDIEKLVPAGNFTVTLDPEDSTCGTPRSSYRRLGDRMPLLVNITLSFNKTYHLMGDLTITFNSGRPEVMILEKSVDYGVTWSPLQYYARNCREFYDRGAGYSITVNDLSAVICDNTSVEITSFPRPGGKVIFGAVGQRLKLLAGPTEHAPVMKTGRKTEVTFVPKTTVSARAKRQLPVADVNFVLTATTIFHGENQIDSDGDSVPARQRNGDGTFGNGVPNGTRDAEGLLAARGRLDPNSQLQRQSKLHNEKLPSFSALDRSRKPRVMRDDTLVDYGDDGMMYQPLSFDTFRSSSPPLAVIRPTPKLGVSTLHTPKQDPLDDGYGWDIAETSFITKPKPCQCLQNVASAMETGTSGVAGDLQCSQCRQNFYGHGSTLGCLPCNCHQTGSTNPQCTEEGQCPCVDSVGGRQCDQCRPGFFAFGTGGCSPCGCDLAGSLNGTCDQTFGTCQCKENVEGTRCDVCKAGYFNLAASNPSGCQPCFCFQHGTVCTSATGFIYDTITSESSVNWNVTDTHFLAPPQFLGDQHVSYGQLLSFYFTGALPFGQVANATLVILEGDQEQSGSVKYVVDALTPATSTSGQVDVRFLAGEWRRADDTNAEESEMLRILADLTALKLPRQLGGTSFAYTDIVMETALAGSEGNVSTYVENCTCDAVSAVSGLSCENCSPGTRRMNVNLTSPYQVCTACDCSGRGLTTPPECDQWTGVCLNCRNGTVGDRCQSCAPFVQGAECDECEDGYWGLGPNGCEACNCSDPGSTSSLCDKDSGQCSCAPFVTGRMCERCEENYHSLSATGCQECDECYKLVMGEVTALRQLVQNMTSSVLLLETNDQTPNLGFFVPRLNDAVDTSQQLLTFLEDTTAAEDSVRGQLVTLTSLTQELSDAVTRLAENTTSDIEAVLSEALVEYENATLVKQAVTDNVQSTYDQIGTLASVVPSLDALAASLETVEAELRTRAQNSETARQAALSELQDLEQVVGQTNTLAQGTLQTVQSALGVHQNNSRRMTQLEGVDVTLNMLATETLTEGRQVRTKSAEVIQSAQGLQTAVATIGQPNIDVAGLSRSVSNVTSRADLLQAQATEADTNFASRQTEIDSAVVQTEALRSRVQALVDGVGGMTSRLTSADRQARAAEQEANSVFQSAENMLQTMQNFEVMAREVEQKTNTSLATVEDMRQASADVRAEAAAVTTSLAASQQAASQAIDIARQAKAIADMQYARLSPVAVSAQALQNSTSTELDNATAAAQRPDALLTAVVQPANETCAEQQQLVANVRSKVESAASSAQQATTRAVMATNRANLLLSNLRNIPSVDLDRIQTLLAEVNSARAQFNATELSKERGVGEVLDQKGIALTDSCSCERSVVLPGDSLSKQKKDKKKFRYQRLRKQLCKLAVSTLEAGTTEEFSVSQTESRLSDRFDLFGSIPDDLEPSNPVSSAILGHLATLGGSNEEYLPIVYPKVVPNGLALCGKTAFGDQLDPNKLMEWFEVQRFLGVDHVQIMDAGNRKDVRKVFKYYTDMGILELLPFELPGEPHVRGLDGPHRVFQQFFHDESFSILDCRQRLAGYTYVLGIDMDEVLMPVQNQDVKTMLKDQLTTHIAGFSGNTSPLPLVSNTLEHVRGSTKRDGP